MASSLTIERCNTMCKIITTHKTSPFCEQNSNLNWQHVNIQNHVRMEKYEEIRVLGEGGYGKAILVRRRSDAQLFVVKVMHIEAMSPKEREEICQEAQLL